MEQSTVEQRKQVAATILQQLGGRQFIAMTGVKNLVSTENSLTMKLARNKSGATHLRIVLTVMDVYHVEFLKLRSTAAILKDINSMPKEQVKTTTTIKEIENVYDDMLVPIFEETTGLYTKLF